MSQPEMKCFILRKGKEEVSAVTCLRQKKQGLTTAPCETYLRLQGERALQREGDEVKWREGSHVGRAETWHMIINNRVECVRVTEGGRQSRRWTCTCLCSQQKNSGFIEKPWWWKSWGLFSSNAAAEKIDTRGRYMRNLWMKQRKRAAGRRDLL